MSNVDALIMQAQNQAQVQTQVQTENHSQNHGQILNQPVVIDQAVQYVQQAANQQQQAQYVQQAANQQQQAQYVQQAANQQQQAQYVQQAANQQQQAQYVQQAANQQQQAQYVQQAANQQQQAQYVQQAANQQQQAQYVQQAANQQQQAQYVQQTQVQPQHQVQQVQPMQQGGMVVQQQQQPMGALPAHLMGTIGQPMEFSMDSFMNMGLAVDMWLKPDHGGLMVGDDTTPVPHVDVEIDMTDKVGFVLVQAIRYGKDPVRYDYTTDNMTSKDGFPWMQVISQAYLVDPTVNPYRAAQIPMTVLFDVLNYKNEVVAKAGTRLGYTTPVTGWAPWETLYRQCQKLGLLGKKVTVRITNESKVKNNNKWGIAKFELLNVQPAAQTA